VDVIAVSAIPSPVIVLRGNHPGSRTTLVGGRMAILDEGARDAVVAREDALVHYQRMRQAMAVIALLIAGLLPTACARFNQRVVTGPAAASAFVHGAHPIHPLCVVFSQERESSDRPNAFSECTDTTRVEARADGWQAAGPSARGAFSRYRVLARKGDRFLLALESSGGGTGQFSNLSWVRLAPSYVVQAKDVFGGDRCAGGLSGYQVSGMTLRFASSATPAEILRLSGVKLADSLAHELTAYSACDGYVNYRYDLASEALTVASVTLRPGTATDAPLGNAEQACFAGVVRHALLGGGATLTTSELEAFGARFVSECAPKGGSGH
jgi:hypothetical protein